MDQATFLRCHVLAFLYFGGVPQEILYDNMKTAFIYSNTDEKWIPNKHLLSLARHYGFTPRRCQVRRPQTKGKVERFIHFYENNFWVEHKSFPVVLNELNEAVLHWAESICQKKINGLNENRDERFTYEESFLTPLSDQAFDCRQSLLVRVSGESLVRVKNNWYSVPPKYIGEKLTVRIDPLTHQAEVSVGEVSIRTLNVNHGEQNRRYYLPEHIQALRTLWQRQYRIPKSGKQPIPKTDVDVRSPTLYDKLFTIGEAS